MRERSDWLSPVAGTRDHRQWEGDVHAGAGDRVLRDWGSNYILECVSSPEERK